MNLTERVGHLTDAYVEPALGRLIVSCYTRRVRRSWVEQSVKRQFDRFLTIFGRLPDYVDGHQHVHQLPVVRDVLLSHMRDLYGSDAAHARVRPWVRSTRACRGLQSTGVRQWFKAKVIESLGALATERDIRTAGFATNNGFAGVYDFTRPAMPYGLMMQRWLDACQPGSLIMSHPSGALLANDPVGQARLTERDVLDSQDFERWLQERGLFIGRGTQLFASGVFGISSRP